MNSSNDRREWELSTRSEIFPIIYLQLLMSQTVLPWNMLSISLVEFLRRWWWWVKFKLQKFPNWDIFNHNNQQQHTWKFEVWQRSKIKHQIPLSLEKKIRLKKIAFNSKAKTTRSLIKTLAMVRMRRALELKLKKKLFWHRASLFSLARRDNF